MVEPLLLSCARILTFDGTQQLTNASGFFFEREQRLYLVTSRHVFLDEPSAHRPTRIEIELLTNPDNVAEATVCSAPLYRGEERAWLEGADAAGAVDVAVLELDRSALPETLACRAFTTAHVPAPEGFEWIEVGTSVLIVGFPLGFYDTLHHMPVVRHAVVASSFGLRFQGQGYFLTDARTHRGSSGAPVVMRAPAPHTAALGDLPWLLLGVHSATLNVAPRDPTADEALGLNCAWYADILHTLTAGVS